tara:strand:+ start:431 stop:631 length:201 start_codon:yes stop_codon:yes gene_type:complete
MEFLDLVVEILHHRLRLQLDMMLILLQVLRLQDLINLLLHRRHLYHHHLHHRQQQLRLAQLLLLQV